MSDLDLDDDFEVFDNHETVYLTRPGKTEAIKVCALRRQLSVREAAASEGAYTARDVQFSIRRSSVCKSPPGVGGVLTSQENEVFTIIGVDKATLKSRFRVWCREPIIDGDLDDDLTFEKPLTLLDGLDAPYTEWTAVYSNVPGKIHIEDTKNSVSFGARQDTPSAMIYAKNVAEVKPNWRVKGRDGVYYNISKVTTPPLAGIAVMEATSARTPLAM